ncbi:MAG: biopolymer transporter ExbD, partial [Opitutaceae bacterium]|nr:biopolymer transporter ExbD [Verrucomicrobiales bacterium]
ETYLGEKATNINLLSQQVRERFPRAKGVFVKADKDTVWDPIAQVISTLGESKLEVKVVTATDDGDGRRRMK